MTKVELMKVASSNVILECEIENAINFVRDLLEMRAKETEKEEPYAVRAIDRYWDASREVYDLLEYIEECEEG